jgi:hypothetical protein
MDDDQAHSSHEQEQRNAQAEQQAAELIDKVMEVTKACRELTAENRHLRHLLAAKKSEVSGNAASNEPEEERLKTHEKTIEALQLQIDEQQDKIFSMQPIQQVSDAEIQRQYKSLCCNISHWVDQYYENGIAKALFGNAINIGWQPKYHDFLSNTLGESGLSLSQGYPASSPAMVEFFLHSSLQWQIFRYRGYCPGSSEKQEEVLHLIERNMRHLTPRRSESLEGC